MDATAYVRVSSRSQDAAMQRHAVERAASARGDRVAAWYSEKRSAKRTDRPELARLRADARAGLVRRLYVYRLDRLCRSGIRDMFEVVEELRAHGCELVTVADGFDLNGPAAEVVLAVMAWAAKMERLAINERISDARERLAAEGKAWGRPSRLTPKERARIAALAAAGHSQRQIAQRTRTPRTTVQAVLRAASPAASGRPAPGAELRYPTPPGR